MKGKGRERERGLCSCMKEYEERGLYVDYDDDAI